MKTMILAAFAALSLGVGASYAQGVPAGSFQEPRYGAQAFTTDHRNEVATQFLGSNTVLGKMFHHSSSDQVTATPQTKG